ncbi:MAG: hypothetical protein KatS3mg016_0437 [Fimbriimonadales bacterium]|nr:MAG: hypothetical protein KatS3mg016_0437 [Fimbriimonadales bacterium]
MSELRSKWLRPTAFWLIAFWLGLAPLGYVLARPCACHQSVAAHACCAQQTPPPTKPDCNHCQLCQATQPNPALITAGLTVPEPSFVAVLPVPLELEHALPARSVFPIERTSPIPPPLSLSRAPRAPPV